MWKFDIIKRVAGIRDKGSQVDSLKNNIYNDMYLSLLLFLFLSPFPLRVGGVWLARGRGAEEVSRTSLLHVSYQVGVLVAKVHGVHQRLVKLDREELN